MNFNFSGEKSYFAVKLLSVLGARIVAAKAVESSAGSRSEVARLKAGDIALNKNKSGVRRHRLSASCVSRARNICAR